MAKSMAYSLQSPVNKGKYIVLESRLRDAEKGNSFAMQTITGESTSVPTLRKGYAKGGSTDPRLLNPENPEKSRLLTAAEHARVKGVPDHLINGLSETLAHQLLGQGIVYAPFESVGHRIGEALLALIDADKKVAESAEDLIEPVRRKRSFGVG